MSISEFNVNVESEYNVLNECRYIRNKDRCIYDSNVGYEARFDKGDNGFTDNFGMNWFMATGYFMWGISTQTSCYISLAEPLAYSFEADFFPDFDLDLLLRYDDNYVTLPTNLNARLIWKMETDADWHADAVVDFTVYPDGIWHRYSINMLEEPRWVGNCVDLRLYIFTDGAKDVEFIIKRLAFKSDYYFKCKFPPCAYNRSYKHPCQGVGTFARAYSSERRRTVKIDDDNSRLGVSIDRYPVKYIDLDLSHCIDCWSVAQDITLKLNTLSFGGYKFAECIYDDIEENFSIYTGTRGSSGSVEIYHGGEKDATEELGFSVSGTGVRAWRTEVGLDPVDGFQEAYQKLPASILYRLPNSTVTTINYDPAKPITEIGRSDLLGLPSETVFQESVIEGFIQIDIFGQSTYGGKIDYIEFKGEIISNKSRLLLLRPSSDSSFSVIYITTVDSSDMKRGQETVYKKSVDWNLKPGDVFGLYMCKPVIHTEDNPKLKPEMVYKYSWVEIRKYNIAVGDELSFSTKDIKFYGYESLPVYGYSNITNPGHGIEAELRYEYGISYASVIGDTNSDVIDINLMTIDSTQVRMSSSVSPGSLQSATDLDLAVEIDSETNDAFWIDFWFPGYIHTIYKMVTYYENVSNLRSFCWEFWAEEDERIGLQWNRFYTFLTEANPIGSAEWWIRLYDPAVVIINGWQDATGTPYLGANYVTADPNDYYPGVEEDIVTLRSDDATGVVWNKLEQTFFPIHTRGLRLYCWRWNSSKVTGVEIYAKFESAQSILQAIEAYGWSGPEVFSTEKYDIVDLEGQIWRSSNISRAETVDYKYDLDFQIQMDEDEATDILLSPVGTTLRKLDFDVKGLPARIQQIKLIGQKLAVRLEAGSEHEPITEVANLSWGAPSDGRDFTYGPSKEYRICNDTGHRANLILNIANPLAIDQACVFSSDLSSLASLEDPYRGIRAELICANDFEICNHRSINYHARAYSILAAEPISWYSTSTSGIVWQTLVSGNPFSDTFRWNEPKDPFSNWNIFNWANSEEITVDSGTLNFSVSSKAPNVERGQWLNPTYFQDVQKESTFYLETKVPTAVAQTAGVDVSAGIVLWDDNDINKYVRLERYSGNNVSTVSGLSYGDLIHLDVPFGDYIRYGDQSYYTLISGVNPTILSVDRPEYGLLFRIAKNAEKVEFAYRLPWDTWTTVSAFSLSGWSKDLRIGVFGSAQAVSRDTVDTLCEVSFDYVSYKASTNRYTEPFDYYFDFDDFVNNHGLWTAHNAETTAILSSTAASGIHIKRHFGRGTYSFFDKYLNSPALLTDWGSTKDYSDAWFRIADYDETTLATGTLTAGVLIRDAGNPLVNYAIYGLNKPDRLLLTITGSNYYIPIDPITSTSGIYLSVQKGVNVLIFNYSYDGNIYNVASGITTYGWSQETAVELGFSSDFNDVTFSNIEVGASMFGATDVTAEFEPPLPVLNIYGRGGDITNIQYATTVTGIEYTTFSDVSPPTTKFIKFTKSRDVEIDTNAIKVIPDPRMAKAVGYPLQQLEIPDYNQQLYDYAGNIQISDGLVTSSGGGWSQDLTYKGIPQFDIPVMAIDLGSIFELGRNPLSISSAKGRFSDSNTDYLIDVSWPSVSYDECGFKRKCLYSSNNECTATIEWGKPKMIYEGEQGSIDYYFAGECNGVSTTAGSVNKACPLFNSGRGRWWLLESTNYSNTTVSAGAVWFLGPLEINHIQKPYPITNNIDWWTTDYGLMHYIDNTAYYPDYTLVYSYPGLNVEGSVYFNGLGNPYWKLATDHEWTFEDKFSIDLSLNNPGNIDKIEIRLGRDPQCCWLFTVTGTLTQTWSSHTWLFKDAEVIINSDIALEEPVYTQHDMEFYQIENSPYRPLPYLNHGYVEVTVSGSGYSDIYMKNMKHIRSRFADDYLFLGINDSLYIPELDLTNKGTIQFDYYPSEAAVNLVEGDPRSFLYSIATVSNANTGLCLVLSMQFGWTIYCFSPEEQVILDFLPPKDIATRVIPSLSNPGPFRIVMSWCPPTIPGLTDTVALWVNGYLVCNGLFESLENYFKTDDIRVTLGRGASVFDYQEDNEMAAYAKFKNLKIYKQSVSRPDIDLDSTALIPENLFELSTDGSTWKSFLNNELPIKVHGVEHGDCTTFYLRNIRPRKEIKALHTRFTANLETMWEVSQ